MINRGDRREPIFLDEEDRKGFLQALGRACAKTGWEVHAYCLLSNHFHLVTETPQANTIVPSATSFSLFCSDVPTRSRQLILFSLDECALLVVGTRCSYHVAFRRHGASDSSRILGG